MQIVSRIKHIALELDRAVEHLYTTAALTAAEVELLVPLRYNDTPMTAIRLAEHLGMSRAGISKTLSKLESRGLLARTPHPRDRRSALLTLTPDGIELVDDLFPRELRLHTQALAGLGSDRTSMITELDRLARTLEIARENR
ncbi:MarR family winged helix-turn-helix transcriptional regulator [Nocardia jiangsuensis]|uniref:MarR family winged helix-turn-helix transcriptional regulator n=1 Tax=Nocardia jiangsuensis TaxID=1691563 RepID=A0ABV8DLN8_9NOCA